MPKKKASHEPEIPSAVSKQEEAANALIAKAAGTEPEPEVATPADPPAEPLKPTHPDPADNVPDSEIDLSVTADPEIGAEAIPTPDIPATGGDWEQKYKVLQGKYNREISDMRESQIAMQGQLNNSQKVIERLEAILDQQTKAPAAPAPAAPANDLVSSATSKIDLDTMDGYGDEVIRLAQGFNSQADLISQLYAKLESIGQPAGGAAPDNEFMQRFETVEQLTVKSAKDKYFDELAAALPNWQTINHDPKFLAWCDQPDPMTGYPRIQILTQSAKALNSQRVIAVFNRYLAESGAPPAQNSAAEPAQDPKANLLVPDATGAVGEETGNAAMDKTKYATREEFNTAKKRFTTQKITEAEFDKVSNRFQAAIAAGLVT